MAPPNNQKRVKGVQIHRPFIYGSTAKLFSEDNPKPPGTPPDHTHSWTVFVKGVDDTDITYWCKKVQFKLHESIPNPMRMIDDVQPGGAFEVHETGWGEFEITIKIYYVPESLEKPQTLYHHLRLHPYGQTEEEKEVMRKGPDIRSWIYEEQLFNEPYNEFYDILTSPMDRGKGGGKGTRVMKGGMVGSVGERTASIPLTTRPDQPFSRETEKIEINRLEEAQVKVKELMEKFGDELREKETELARLKAKYPDVQLKR
ncbi:yeats-domain-containing protein [Mollisia scopiformis]|uniref:Protein AF-9 homolog n=1 Tax=Mollisia scopiformis TaxID=149040 RepID=A0A132B4H7_MOLSC|nr:yeats-domain-containing protein [Mollisia scopiformis]KUJ07143.1 yeats-domain-containing protein [Mollisia scopiformis]